MPAGQPWMLLPALAAARRLCHSAASAAPFPATARAAPAAAGLGEPAPQRLLASQSLPTSHLRRRPAPARACLRAAVDVGCAHGRIPKRYNATYCSSAYDQQVSAYLSLGLSLVEARGFLPRDFGFVTGAFPEWGCPWAGACQRGRLGVAGWGWMPRPGTAGAPQRTAGTPTPPRLCGCCRVCIRGRHSLHVLLPIHAGHLSSHARDGALPRPVARRRRPE